MTLLQMQGYRLVVVFDYQDSIRLLNKALVRVLGIANSTCNSFY
jgi:hypothetical protein